MTGEYIHLKDTGEEPSEKGKCPPNTCPQCNCKVGEEE